MKNEIATRTEPRGISALGLMGQRLNVDPAKLMQTLKATCFKNATDEEMLALVVVANEYKLNPLTKEIYAFPAKGGGITPVVSIDGWVSMVNDHPQMDGMEFVDVHDPETGSLQSITCRLYRKDRSRPIEVTEYLSECKRATDPWKMEHRMLRHKALMQCARYAFGFSGVTDEDEASETPSLRNITPQAAPLTDHLAKAAKKGDIIDEPAPEPLAAEQPKKVLTEEEAWGEEPKDLI